MTSTGSAPISSALIATRLSSLHAHLSAAVLAASGPRPRGRAKGPVGMRAAVAGRAMWILYTARIGPPNGPAQLSPFSQPSGP